MKRDDDYIRALLFEAEASNNPSLLAMLPLDNEPEKVKRHVHAQWLCDAGLFEQVGKHAFRITNQGHDYLSAIRDEGIWNRTKAAAGSVGGVTLGIMRDIAVSFVKQEVAKHTGLPL